MKMYVCDEHYVELKAGPVRRERPVKNIFTIHTCDVGNCYKDAYRESVVNIRERRWYLGEDNLVTSKLTKRYEIAFGLLMITATFVLGLLANMYGLTVLLGAIIISVGFLLCLKRIGVKDRLKDR